MKARRIGFLLAGRGGISPSSRLYAMAAPPGEEAAAAIAADVARTRVVFEVVAAGLDGGGGRRRAAVAGRRRAAAGGGGPSPSWPATDCVAGSSESQLPDWVKRRLRDQSKRVDLGCEGRRGGDRAAVPTEQRLQCREGRKRSISLGPVRDTLTLADPDDSDAEPQTWQRGGVRIRPGRRAPRRRQRASRRDARNPARPAAASLDRRARDVSPRQQPRLRGLLSLRVAVTLTPGQTLGRRRALADSDGSLGDAFFRGTDQHPRHRGSPAGPAGPNADRRLCSHRPPLVTPTATPAQPVTIFLPWFLLTCMQGVQRWL